MGCAAAMAGCVGGVADGAAVRVAAATATVAAVVATTAAVNKHYEQLETRAHSLSGAAMCFNPMDCSDNIML
ncbi:hypothetical protein F0562_015239 [Nyssa sinensis]|uniref:Uncharacterized protein n=1 Tax=Nyssa sinensis TaxID=561372 RepID=A0A5J4ZJL5_9ASTE|nr:hypothetical protein F0562_015239 [Nyssa sinensis]